MKVCIIGILLLYSIVLISCNTSGTDKPVIRNGYKAPDLKLPDVDGKLIEITKTKKGKYVLYDFWASWCAPCRKTNANLVSWKKTGRLKNLDIISISFDTDFKAWKQAIQTDSLFWSSHYCDGSGGASDQMKELQIQSIPYSYLVNQKGQIMAVNPRLHKIEQLIAN